MRHTWKPLRHAIALLPQSVLFSTDFAALISSAGYFERPLPRRFATGLSTVNIATVTVTTDEHLL